MIFLDLDDTLVKTYQGNKVPSFLSQENLPKIKDSKRKLALVTLLRNEANSSREFLVIARPCLEWFLKSCISISNINLLTSAYLDYAKDVLNCLEISQYFSDVFSTYNSHKKFNLNLSPKWVLVDNSPVELCKLKFEKLGLDVRNKKIVSDHFIRISNFVPYQSDNALRDLFYLIRNYFGKKIPIGKQFL